MLAISLLVLAVASVNAIPLEDFYPFGSTSRDTNYSVSCCYAYGRLVFTSSLSEYTLSFLWDTANQVSYFCLCLYLRSDFQPSNFEPLLID